MSRPPSVLRGLLLGLLVVVLTVLCGIPSVLVALLDRSGLLAQRAAGFWAHLLLTALGVEVEVQGAEHVPPGPAVYAANHGSILDIPIVFAFLPADFRIIHKASLRFVPVVGQYLKLAGHVAIDRGNAFRARRSLDEAAARIRAGTSVAVFPEGTRSEDGHVRRFKRGSFVLAIEAGVPVVPVSLAGVKRVMPRGIATLHPGRVTLVVHPAIPTAGLSPEAAEELADRVRAVVTTGCAEAAA